MPKTLFHSLNQMHTLIEKTPQNLSDKIILIGGQALIAWVHAYNIDTLTGEQYINLASDDIDFMGSKASVIECATCWSGQAILPTMDDNTEQTGRVRLTELNTKGEAQVVDFLGKTYGIPTCDVEKWCDKLVINNSEKSVQVISPPLCLLSRIKNLTGYMKNSCETNKARELSRVKSAITITHSYVIDIVKYDLENNSNMATKKVVRYLTKTLLKDKEVIKLSSLYSIDFDDIFPEIIKRVDPNIYNQDATTSLNKFKNAVDKKTKSRTLRERQKAQKLHRLAQKITESHPNAT